MISYMRKFGICLIVISMLFAMVACSNTEYESNSNDAPATAIPQNDNHTESQPPTDDNQNKDPLAKLNAFSTEATIDEAVLYDQSNVKISVVSVDYGKKDAKIEFLFENNTTKELTISAGTVGYTCFAVNGIMMADGYVSCDIAAGKKATENIDLDYYDLQLYGVDALQNIEIGFKIDDGDEYVYTGPLQIDTSWSNNNAYSQIRFADRIQDAGCMNAYSYDVLSFSDQAISLDNGVNILSSCLIKNSEGNQSLFLEVKNTGTEEIEFKTSDISINDLIVYESGTWSYDRILPEHTAIIDIQFSKVFPDEYWSIYGIEEIAAVGFGAVVDTEENDGEKQIVNIVTADTPASFNTEGSEIFSNESIRLIFKGILDDPSEYSNDIYILLLVENKLREEITLTDKYDSYSMNGFMGDCSFYSVDIAPEKYAFAEIKLYEYMLEDTDIKQATDIKDFGITFELKNDNYKTIEEIEVQHIIEP